jgi:hypothetical protein
LMAIRWGKYKRQLIQRAWHRARESNLRTPGTLYALPEHVINQILSFVYFG